MSSKESSGEYSSEEGYSDDETFQKKDGGQKTYPVKAGQLRKGGYVVAKHQFPCQIVHTSVSKTGKHGHAKCHITAIDIFTGKKYEILEGSGHNLDVPNVTKMERTLISLSHDGDVSYLQENGEFNEDLTMDTTTELFERIQKFIKEKKDVLISITTAMGTTQVTGCRVE